MIITLAAVLDDFPGYGNFVQTGILRLLENDNVGVVGVVRVVDEVELNVVHGDSLLLMISSRLIASNTNT